MGDVQKGLVRDWIRKISEVNGGCTGEGNPMKGQLNETRGREETIVIQTEVYRRRRERDGRLAGKCRRSETEEKSNDLLNGESDRVLTTGDVHTDRFETPFLLYAPTAADPQNRTIYNVYCMRERS